jgi:nitrogen fixation protein NifU and related proteins
VSSELRDLYQEVILDHSKRPRNFRALDGQARKADGFNPLCGDKVTIYVEIADGVVKDVSFQGSGCAISTASASVMTEVLKGKTRAEADALFRRFHALVTGDAEATARAADLGKLAVFAGVSEFPARVKCAVLAWHTLQAALKGEREPVSTE